MITQLKNYLLDVRDRQRIIIALTKGGATMNARRVDLMSPATWEFSGFSQNGEDGIIDVLRKQLLTQNRYFVEIGCSDGIENNSSWLVVAEKLSGIMIEGDPTLAERAKRMIAGHSVGGECRNMFVTRENVHELKRLMFHNDPDVFSLDIDGNDYYIAKAILDNGIRPKIFVVEFNSVFGPERSTTVAYRDDFVFSSAHPTQLYYGVSIKGWRNFFEAQGYQFVTIDQNGVNAFFVDPAHFDRGFLKNIMPLSFAENLYQYRKFRISSADQFKLIENEQFVDI
ncbi:MAG: hypothetical protein KXJ61_16160 [Hydrogenophaga sp.]|jgi:hypothetical protein|uniref:hypothetical protein n=1 Tax=Hydrogenophaga sp. TaxID=1904254 RepID=UPI001DF6A908|nr:hypothetical protein [Hydrogenophaga sp.]MBW0171754.1 hypothetical protein [Hydrogenophaga sp.]MBW0184054.1 hypothetical protein [Hydrogenophaga sp.]